MDYTQTVQDVLADFGKNIGLESLQLGEEGYCRMQVDDSLEINFELDSKNGLLLFLTPIAKANPKLYADCLELNMLFRELRGARFILIREANLIALMKAVEVDQLTLSVFEVQLEEFIQVAQNWIDAFSESPEATKENEEKPAITHTHLTNRA